MSTGRPTSRAEQIAQQGQAVGARKALHEASHAVVAKRVGASFTRVTINPGRTPVPGGVKPNRGGVDTLWISFSNDDDRVMTALAGLVADHLQPSPSASARTSVPKHVMDLFRGHRDYVGDYEMYCAARGGEPPDSQLEVDITTTMAFIHSHWATIAGFAPTLQQLQTVAYAQVP